MARDDQQLYDISEWLDYAIGRLEQGDSPEAILPHIPAAYREEIAALLPVVQWLRQLPEVAPSPAFRGQSPQRLLQRLQTAAPFSVTRPSPVRLWLRNITTQARRWAVVWITAVVILALIGSGGSVAYAASGVLPGHPLYPVKLWIEDLQLLLAPPEQDMELYQRFIERRLEEIEALVEAGRTEGMDQAIQRWRQLQDQMTQEMDELPPDRRTQVLQSLLERTARHEQVLSELQERAPEPARAALQHAYEMSQKWRQAIQHAIEAPRRGEKTPPGPPITPGPKVTPPGWERRPVRPTETQEPRPPVTPGPFITPPGQERRPAGPGGAEEPRPAVTPGPPITPPGWERGRGGLRPPTPTPGTLLRPEPGASNTVQPPLTAPPRGRGPKITPPRPPVPAPVTPPLPAAPRRP